MSNKSAGIIEGQKALIVVDQLLQNTKNGQRLNDLQSAVFLGSWAQNSYAEIAQQLGYKYNYDYIKQVGSRLWRNLSQILGEPVSKRNIQGVLRRYEQSKFRVLNFDCSIAHNCARGTGASKVSPTEFICNLDPPATISTQLD